VTSKESKTEALAQEIVVHCVARYPLLSVETIEEKRALASVAAAAAAMKREVVTWSVTDGLVCDGVWTPGTEPTGADGEKITDPGEALEWLHGELSSSRDVEEDFLFVMLDPAEYLDDAKVNVSYVRRMRDIARRIKETPSAPSKAKSGRVIPPPPKRNVVMVGPEFKFPTGLLESVTGLELKLPTMAMLDRGLADMEAGLPAEVKPSPEEREMVLKAGLGLTMDGFSDVLARSLAEQRALVPAIVSQEKQQVVNRSKVAVWVPTVVTMDDVGGMEELKPWLDLRGLGFSEAARDYGLRQPKGMLCGGPPGTGKSLTAQAVAAKFGLPLLRAGQLKASFVGDSQKNQKKFLQTCSAVAPCVVWYDEVEKVMAGAGSGGETDGGVADEMLGDLLTWMQEQEGCFVVFTSNQVMNLPAELLRKGRLDELWFVDFPNIAERGAIWEVKFKAKGRDIDVFDGDELVKLSDGMSGAEIEAVLEAAMFSAFAGGVEVTQDHVVAELGKVIPLSVTMGAKLDALRKWCDGKLRPASKPDVVEQETGDNGRLAGIVDVPQVG
jgi:ATP-dependent 26S proteasome regulatory subunit